MILYYALCGRTILLYYQKSRQNNYYIIMPRCRNIAELSPENKCIWRVHHPLRDAIRSIKLSPSPEKRTAAASTRSRRTMQLQASNTSNYEYYPYRFDRRPIRTVMIHVINFQRSSTANQMQPARRRCY